MLYLNGILYEVCKDYLIRFNTKHNYEIHSKLQVVKSNMN